MPDRTTIGLSLDMYLLDSPAAKSRIETGDVIVAVNGVRL